MSSFARMRPGRGFSLLELVVVIGVVAVLVAIAAERMLRYVELAEKVTMETTVSTLKSALALRFAAAYLGGQQGEIARLPLENPFDWLAERPGTYVGELYDPRLKDLPRGVWYFDRSRRQTVYVPARTRYLVADPSGDPRIFFLTRVNFGPSSVDDRRRELKQLDLAPTVAYNWFRDSQ